MKRSLDSRVDYSLILPVFCLLVIGVVAIYIAVSHDYPHNIWPILGQQLAWIVLGIVISFVVMFFNTKIFMAGDSLSLCPRSSPHGLTLGFLQP